MHSDSGTRSCWHDAALRLDRSPLRADAKAEVCIIGAGITGLLCAYTLARAGIRPVVIDDGPIGGGETGRTTAHLANAIDDRYFEIERMHGAEGARICAESHTHAITLVERIVADEAIDCAFARLDGYLFLPPAEDPELLRRELDAARRAGLGDVQFVDRAPSFDSGPCLRFPRQAQLHPLRLLASLAAATERMGGVIHTGTHAKRISFNASVDVVTAAGPIVFANAVIIATNSPFNDLVSIHTKQSAHRTYALSARLPVGAVAPALHWDTSQRAGDLGGPYHYVRVHPAAASDNDDLLIVGGGDHHTGEQTDGIAHWASLESWARERWPVMGAVTHRWSGQVMEPHDGVAFIGRNPSGPERVFVVTGDSGMGMTHAAIAAAMLPDLIRGQTHSWEKLYDPSRKPTTALGEFAGEGARVAAHYADWLTPGADIEHIPPGEGAIVRRGLRLLAVHRDSAGQLHTRSAVCPHLGCVVGWNHAEKTWDCPCHGSRFNAHGEVINGPSPRNLDDRAL